MIEDALKLADYLCRRDIRIPNHNEIEAAKTIRTLVKMLKISTEPAAWYADVAKQKIAYFGEIPPKEIPANWQPLYTCSFLGESK
jgi:hypothetical protein